MCYFKLRKKAMFVCHFHHLGGRSSSSSNNCRNGYSIIYQLERTAKSVACRFGLKPTMCGNNTKNHLVHHLGRKPGTKHQMTLWFEPYMLVSINLCMLQFQNDMFFRPYKLATTNARTMKYCISYRVVGRDRSASTLA